MKNRIENLILNQIMGELTPLEVIELENFKSESGDNRKLVDDLINPRHLSDAIIRSRKLDVSAQLKKAWEEIKKY